METIVKLRHIKQSARKVRFILNTLRGLKVGEALNKLSLSNKKASIFIKKAIESGLSNLSTNNNDTVLASKLMAEYAIKNGSKIIVSNLETMENLNL